MSARAQALPQFTMTWFNHFRALPADTQYALQACENLAQEMIARGWPADAAHFRKRQRELMRQGGER